MDAIRIEGLTKKYKDVVAVDSLDLTISEGELFSLLGVNGAGKTTTIKMLSCLTSPTSGDAFLKGNSIINNAAAVKSLIAVSPQETAVAPGLSVYENLEFICGVHGFSKEKREKKCIKEACEEGLPEEEHPEKEQSRAKEGRGFRVPKKGFAEKVPAQEGYGEGVR